jgi:hypothetical protein
MMKNVLFGLTAVVMAAIARYLTGLERYTGCRRQSVPLKPGFAMWINYFQVAYRHQP